MNTNQTPSTEQAIEAARILGLYFNGTGIDHEQHDESDAIQAFATAGAAASGVYGQKSANMRELTALTYLQEQMAYVVEDIIDRARLNRESWADIGDAIGVSRQAAQQRFGA